MTLRVVPECLVGASAAIEASAAQLAAVHAEAALGAQRAWTGSQWLIVEELGRSGVGAAESGANYALGDALAAASYLGGGQ
ncbi:hypothetical protein [Mycobacterium haemophilum]|uniref:PE domain-containing protein n=1 Tax=Mycobacterium haemophilum TaxID=29311 RepID=A0A0I9XJ84_9MYCO|nr:hypothetical protein [Mycobacterium haemophilum]KLO26877.1 hypothetical protein ABH39_16975 [Mycobacterium haemophilum]KLO34883.1 hypothetical protein ABH38_17700 [Mycobacterium haemophilum]KLO39865.1 hypothetical protein ABH37_17520 [Mycobacterium haemophilum]KLO46905.1 hypothetical protein ABH36_17630 [Mycobacterium haemophilum]